MLSTFGRLVCIVAATGSLLAPAVCAQTTVYLGSTTPDNIGQQLAYQVREALRRSTGLNLADRPEDARMSVLLVTLDPYENGASAHQSTIYSAVVTFRTFHKPPVDMYVTNYVGICGVSRTAFCAESIVSAVDEQATGFRRAMKDILDPTKKP